MSERSVRIEGAAHIPAEWGRPRTAVRKGTISLREPSGNETFAKPWGTLSARPGEDYVAVEESGDEYPIKKAIFARTYEAVAPGRYRKSAPSRLVQVPEGWTAVLATLEGKIVVRHPDYVAIGPDGEVYANARDWVAANLEFIE
ncbi:MAG TPA: hypothetical protein VF811_04645 [Parasulfuritortus sp.]